MPEDKPVQSDSYGQQETSPVCFIPLFCASGLGWIKHYNLCAMNQVL